MRLLVISALAIVTVLPTHAQTPELSRVEQGQIRIDLAGSQRMLSQRIARNACFVAAGLEAQPLIDTMQSDIATFDARVVSVLDGDTERGVDPERSPIIRQDYEGRILPSWTGMRLNTQALGARGNAGVTDIELISEAAEQILADLETTILNFEEKYARGRTMSAEASRTTNVYAAQRMLAQRIAGQYCLVGIGLGTSDVRENLRTSFERFDRANADMKAGNFDARIMAPSAELAGTLACVRAEIEEIRPLITAAPATPPNRQDMQAMLEASDRMMALSQAAVSALVDDQAEIEITAPGCNLS